MLYTTKSFRVALVFGRLAAHPDDQPIFSIFTAPYHICLQAIIELLLGRLNAVFAISDMTRLAPARVFGWVDGRSEGGSRAPAKTGSRRLGRNDRDALNKCFDTKKLEDDVSDSSRRIKPKLNDREANKAIRNPGTDRNAGELTEDIHNEILASCETSVDGVINSHRVEYEKNHLPDDMRRSTKLTVRNPVLESRQSIHVVAQRGPNTFVG
ncbi:hypothetical protein FHL15_004657 [Xylaria flabelliformis]|uniref:Uncharacterized protein n=1 Tax=Xylaria flabelliformis TaxID=2512241 RepID=A0A553I2S4_9PEZI|nr:hypothetical protein FHL15_004657 [Xylaria flabelliformis]